MYIGLTSHDVPTGDRWLSFGWRIAGDINVIKLGSTNLYRYSVEPIGDVAHPQFPVDMLRYDRAYPSSQMDSSELVRTIERRAMMLAGAVS